MAGHGDDTTRVEHAIRRVDVILSGLRLNKELERIEEWGLLMGIREAMTVPTGGISDDQLDEILASMEPGYVCLAGDRVDVANSKVVEEGYRLGLLR